MVEIENNILSLLKSDPERALSLMYDEFYNYLFSVVHRKLLDESETQDIIQSVFIDIWTKREKLLISSSLKYYLRRAAINKSLNYIRSKKKMVEEDIQLEHVDLKQDYDQSLILEADDLQIQIDGALDALPPKCKIIFSLSRFEEMTYNQIAEELGISIKTVENQITKALKIMRNKIYEKNK